MKGKCLNQGGLSSWLQISSAANIEFIKFQVRFFFEAAMQKLSASKWVQCLKILICQSGQQWRFAPSVLLVVVLCVVLCVYHIYGAGAYRVHLIMGSFLSCLFQNNTTNAAKF